MKYYRCFQLSQKSNECPSRQQLQILEVKSEEDQEREQNELEGNEVEELGDEGKTIVCILEMLLIAPRQLIHSQWKAIFHTKCTISKKVCDLIIDSGCIENIVSRATVQALQ